MLKRWSRFAGFLEDGRICLTNNAAERSLRGFALGRKAWLFAGFERGAYRAAVMATLITTAKLNDVDPQAWLADALITRIAATQQSQLSELLPWHWRRTTTEHRSRSLIRRPSSPDAFAVTLCPRRMLTTFTTKCATHPTATDRGHHRADHGA